MTIDIIAKYQMYILFFQETERYIFWKKLKRYIHNPPLKNFFQKLI